MGTIDTAFKTAFRDYNTDGVASSGIKQPSKSEIRSIGETIESYFDAPWTLSANVTVTALSTAPTGYVAQFVGASANANQFVLMDGYGGIPGFRTRRANVTASAASAVQNNEVISTWDGFAYGATAFSASARAQIRYVATQNWTDSAHGTKIVFSTTPNNSTTMTDRLNIDQDGSITANSTFTTSGPSVIGAERRNTGIQYSTATSGSITLVSTTSILIHEPGTTVSTLTITFPSSPSDGQMQTINFVSAVTTLTWTPSAGTTIAVAPGNPAANSVFSFIYRVASTKWYRI